MPQQHSTSSHCNSVKYAVFHGQHDYKILVLDSAHILLGGEAVLEQPLIQHLPCCLHAMIPASPGALLLEVQQRSAAMPQL